MIALVLGTLSGWTQGLGVVYEGTQHFYKVQSIEGYTYAWEVYRGNDPPDPTSQGDFEFIGDPALANIGVQWNVAGLYYLTVIGTDMEGCNNRKAMAVQVIPNDRLIGFVASAGDACFNANGNDFDLALTSTGNFKEDEFPLTINYTVNGVWFSNVVESNNLMLSIGEPDFIADPLQETAVEVEIKEAIDVNGIEINADPDKDLHIRTIFPVPVIEFTEELRRTYYHRIHEANMAYTYYSVNGIQLVEPD